MGYIFLLLNFLSGQVQIGYKSSGELVNMLYNTKITATRRISNGKPLSEFEQFVYDGNFYAHWLTDSFDPIDLARYAAPFPEKNMTWVVRDKSLLPTTATSSINVWYPSTDFDADSAILFDMEMTLADFIAQQKQPTSVVQQIRSQRALVLKETHLADRVFGNVAEEDENAFLRGIDTCASAEIAAQTLSAIPLDSYAAKYWCVVSQIIGYYSSKNLTRFI